MKVSFLIAAFNEERYLRACILSCLSQTYTDVEVCVVNDGSTDDTRKVFFEFDGDPRVRTLSLDKNGGKVGAFNRAFSMASGDLYCLVGADDTCPEDRVAKCVEVLDRTGANLVYGDYAICDEALCRLAVKSVEQTVTPATIIFNNVIPGGTMLFDRSVAELAFPIPESLRFEDWWIAFIGVFYFKVAPVGSVLLNYRIHGRNDSIDVDGLGSKRKDFMRHGAYVDEFVRFLSAHPVRDVDRYVTIAIESRLLKEIYVANRFADRLRKSLEFFRKHGLPLTKRGWFSVLIMVPLGWRGFDWACYVVQHARR